MTCHAGPVYRWETRARSSGAGPSLSGPRSGPKGMIVDEERDEHHEKRKADQRPQQFGVSRRRIVRWLC